MNTALFDKKYAEGDSGNYSAGFAVAWQNFRDAMPEEFLNRRKAKSSLRRFLRKLRTF